MTTHHSRSRGVSARVEPADIEEANVTEAVRLERAASALGARQLLLRQLDWDKLFSSATVPGAPQPNVARAAFNRYAHRASELRRKIGRGQTDDATFRALAAANHRAARRSVA